MNDVISRLYQMYLDWVWWMPSETYCFFIRAMLLFGIPTALCCFAYRQGNRNVLFQCLCLAVGVLTACAMPLGNPSNPVLKTWMITMSMVALAFLPGILPVFVVPEYGTQRYLRWLFYGILAVLFLLNYFKGFMS